MSKHVPNIENFIEIEKKSIVGKTNLGRMRMVPSAHNRNRKLAARIIHHPGNQQKFNAAIFSAVGQTPPLRGSKCFKSNMATTKNLRGFSAFYSKNLQMFLSLFLPLQPKENICRIGLELFCDAFRLNCHLLKKVTLLM